MSELMIMAPRVHLNGTSREVLLEDYLDAKQAVRLAIGALKACAPNGRDYYVIGPEAIDVAQKQHADRVHRLVLVLQELDFIAQEIDRG